MLCTTYLISSGLTASTAFSICLGDILWPVGHELQPDILRNGCVVALVNSDRDLDSPVDNTEPVAVGILPVGGDFGEQGLESNIVLVLVLQSVLLASQSRHILLGCVLEFSGKSDGVTKPSGDGGLDLGDGTSETTITANEDVLRVGLAELIIGGVAEATCLLVRPRILSLGSPLLVFIP